MTTFLKFPPHIPVDPVLLARCGFYYTGYRDRVKCFRFVYFNVLIGLDTEATIITELL